MTEPATAVAARPRRVLKSAAVHAAPLVAFDADGGAEEAALQELADALEGAYRQGVADGRAAADESGLAAVPRLVDAIAAATAAAADAAARQAATDVSTVMTVAAEVARWIVGEQAAADPSILLARLEAVLPALVASAPIEIDVAPAAADSVAGWAGRDVVVRPDPALGPGEALVRAGVATADLRLDVAIERALGALTGEGHDV